MIKENIKHREVATAIRNELLKPTWVPGCKLASEKALMEQYGIGRNTVRNALQRLESEGIISRHRGQRSVLVQKPVNYKNLRRGINIGLVVSASLLDSASSCLPRIARHIIEGFNRWDATLSLFPFLSDTRPLALEHVDFLLSRNLVDGFFLENTPDCIDIGNYLHKKKVPFTYIFHTINAQFPIEQLNSFPAIINSEFGLVRQVVNSYRENGIKRLVLLGSPDDYREGRTYDLFRPACAQANLELISVPFPETDIAKVIGTVKIYSTPDTCLLLSNELVKEVDYSLNHCQLAVERDVHILLFRHYTPDWTHWEQKYPIIAFDPKEFGHNAADMMHRLFLAYEADEAFPEQCHLKLPCRLIGKNSHLLPPKKA